MLILIWKQQSTSFFTLPDLTEWTSTDVFGKDEELYLPSSPRFSAGSHRYFSDIDMLEYFHPPALQGYLLRPGSTLDRQRFSFSYFQTSHLLELFCGMEQKGVVFFLVP